MRTSVRVVLVAGLAGLGMASGAKAVPNPVATNDAAYMVFGRAFPDPQGCGVNPIGDPVPVSPWAKGRVCADQFLSYDELIAGTSFLQQKHSRYMQIIRLDQAFDDPEMKSAGLPTNIGLDEDGEAQVISRDRRPLYLFKITDSQSPIPERERKHFAYSMSIHGIERAGLEGGIRAMEDLVTWAHCEVDPASSPACADEGPFPKPIVETPVEPGTPIPTAGETLRNAVIYFYDANPDGWGRGEVSKGGFFFQRYNGNGVDLNRDWPTVGYTFKQYSPGSEPETRALAEVLRGIKQRTASGRFAGGIDLHGQQTPTAFSFTLLGAGQRDYRRNFSSVDQALRAWRDQLQRLGWSPYVSDKDRDGVKDANEICSPFCVADQWGSVVDTLGYQVTGSVGDWMDSDKLGLGAVGIDNEMSLSHIVPNIAFEPINEQMHVDGNKGLIYSQLSAMLTEQPSDFDFTPTGRIGYVLNRKRISNDGLQPPDHPDLPAQNTITATLPCADCGGGEFAMDGTQPTLEFDVLGPDRGVFNGGITVTATWPSVQGVSPSAATTRVWLDKFEEDQWQPVATSRVSESTYLTAGQIVTANDPTAQRWRVRLTNAAGGPARVTIDFRQIEAESGPGQAPFSASSTDFFDDLNKYIPDPELKTRPVTVEQVIDDPHSLRKLDSLVVVNEALPAYADAAGTPLELTDAERERYFANLKGYAEGGGNLVLTDAALAALETLELTPPGSVSSNLAAGRGAVPRYEFSLGGVRGNLCTPTTDDPLVRDVCLPGTAGGSARQAVEPTPLGYTPDTTLDNDNSNKFRQYHVARAAWEAGCGATCTSGLLNNRSALGIRPLGLGRVTIAGALLPDPIFNPNATRDMRFGLASYALSPAGWQIALNAVDYSRPAAQAELSVVLEQVPNPATVGRAATWIASVSNAGPDDATGVQLTVDLPSGAETGLLPFGCSAAGPHVTCDLGAVAADDVREIAIPATLFDAATFDASASVAGDQDDPDPSNNAASSSGSSTCTIVGTAGRDKLTGTNGADVVCGLGGNDTVRGGKGDDVVVGGEGNDKVDGDDGDDLVDGGPGADELDGGNGIDTCRRDALDARVRNCEG